VQATGGTNGSTRPGRPLVVATTSIVADLVRRIGGDDVDVAALMGAGVDPHMYKASEGDVRRLDGAALVIQSGLHLEGKMSEVLEKLSRRKRVVAVGEAVPEQDRRAPPEFAGQYDPHIWFDVSLWTHGIEPVTQALGELLPRRRADFEQRAAGYRAELQALDAWVQARIATIPSERRVLITAHDAFGYFGRRYAIKVVGIQGISTATEAGLGDMQRVVDLVVERRIPAIFVESSVPHRSIEAVQAACRQRGHEVKIGGELFSDSLGPADEESGTYVGMVRRNVETIVTALAGAPVS
jgi:manganese/zinc/iron transport system substrate-binding protein